MAVCPPERNVARKKTPAVRIDVKAQVSRRLRELRIELFGEHGGPEISRRLNLPARTWYNYETGVTVPAEVLLGFIDQTGANPIWLLTGQGPRYRHPSDGLAVDDLTPQELIQKSLDKLLEARDSALRDDDSLPDYVAMDVLCLEQVSGVECNGQVPRGRILADRSWIPNPERTIAARLDDDAMAPILPRGSVVAIDSSSRDPKLLSGRIAAALIDGRSIVRWAERSGRHLILRANEPRGEFPMIPLECDTEAPEEILGQVVWSWSRFEEH